MATVINIKAAAAEATAQTDLLRNSIHRLSNNDRVVVYAGLGGGSAAGDTEVELYVGDISVATLLNLATTPITGYQALPVDAYLPAGVELRAIVRTAVPSGQTGYLFLELDDVYAEDQGMEQGYYVP